MIKVRHKFWGETGVYLNWFVDENGQCRCRIRWNNPRSLMHEAIIPRNLIFIVPAPSRIIIQ